MKTRHLILAAGLIAPLGVSQAGEKTFGDGLLQQRLACYDVDGNGVINEEERQAMVRSRAEWQHQLREQWDTDGDGVISEPEREQARDRLREMIQERRLECFTAADTDGDGALNLGEFSALPGMTLKTEEDVLRIFTRLDTDPVDGLVTVDEFLTALRKTPRDRDGSGDGSGGTGGTGGGGTGGGGKGS